MSREVNDKSNEKVNNLETLIRYSFNEMMKGVHTMLPGKVESFDPSNQLAKVNLVNRMVLKSGAEVQFPPLINVPVQQFR